MADAHDLIKSYQINELKQVIKTSFFTGEITGLTGDPQVATILLNNPNATTTLISGAEILYNIPEGANSTTTDGGDKVFKLEDEVLIMRVIDANATPVNKYYVMGFLDGLHPAGPQLLFTTVGGLFDFDYDSDAGLFYSLELNYQRIMRCTITGANKSYWTPKDSAARNVVDKTPSYFPYLTIRNTDKYLSFNGYDLLLGDAAYRSLWNTTVTIQARPAADMAIAADDGNIYILFGTNQYYVSIYTRSILKIDSGLTLSEMEIPNDNYLGIGYGGSNILLRNSTKISRIAWGGSVSDIAVPEQYRSNGQQLIAYKNGAIYFNSTYNGENKIIKYSGVNFTEILNMESETITGLKIRDGVIYFSVFNDKVYRFFD